MCRLVAAWAHPRSRGENGSLFLHRHMVLGSSPLMRGKHRSIAHVDVRKGLIPADARKTRPRDRGTVADPAYPRSRGENYAPPCGKLLMSGSSPLMQGKHLRCALPEQRNGLIPAHAGKTGRRYSRTRSARAHPRSRGDNTFTFRVSPLAPDSSPLTRGKPGYRVD